MNQHLALPARIVGIICLTGTPAWSDKSHKGKHDEGHVADLVKDAKVTIDQGIKTAMDKVPGTVVEAEREKKHDKIVWEVEVLGADGKVTEVHIDAVTGTIIDTEATQDKPGKKAKH